VSGRVDKYLSMDIVGKLEWMAGQIQRLTVGNTFGDKIVDICEQLSLSEWLSGRIVSG